MAETLLYGRGEHAGSFHRTRHWCEIRRVNREESNQTYTFALVYVLINLPVYKSILAELISPDVLKTIVDLE